jgi:hypothetical protein
MCIDNLHKEEDDDDNNNNNNNNNKYLIKGRENPKMFITLQGTYHPSNGQRA